MNLHKIANDIAQAINEKFPACRARVVDIDGRAVVKIPTMGEIGVDADMLDLRRAKVSSAKGAGLVAKEVYAAAKAAAS